LGRLSSKVVIMSRSANATPPAAPPKPEPTYFWEDFPVGQVREFGGKRMEADEIVSFASAYDPQPFHLSEEGGKASLFGGLCASGWHTCAVTMRMMCDHYLLDSASLGSPGLESLKWLKPVFAGDVLRVRMTVLEARPMNSRPDVGLLRTQHEVFNQHDEVVLRMESWAMMRRRAGRSPA
jgi:acyl dehydratase